MKRELGIITSATLGIEDHGFLTSWLMLDFGGTSQGFGGYNLGGPFLDEYIRGILDAVGVADWRDLVGKDVWVEREKDERSSPIVVIESPKFRKNTTRFDVRLWQEKTMKAIKK